jgi:hypothetical protein
MKKRISVVMAITTLGLHCGGGSDGGAPPAVDAGSSSDAEASADGQGPYEAGSPKADGGGSSSSGGGSHDGGGGSDGGGHDAGSSGGPGVVVDVTNGCPFDLWIHATGKEATLQPDNVHLAHGSSQTYTAPFTWSSARVYAYFEAPDSSGNPQGQNDKIEASFYVQNGSEYLNTDITYVDWVALPSQIQTLGTGSDCTTVGCDAPSATLLQGCPPSLLSGHECVSAGYYCLTTPNKGDPYCHALDSQIGACASEYADCAGAAGSTTAEVYSCSGGFFGGNPEYCAALNRGVLATPAASTPASAFYQSPPFDTYAQWVHQKCPGIYAFPYDDFGSSNQSSDHTCTGATQMNVTFCPKG